MPKRSRKKVAVKSVDDAGGVRIGREQSAGKVGDHRQEGARAHCSGRIQDDRVAEPCRAKLALKSEQQVESRLQILVRSRLRRTPTAPHIAAVARNPSK